MGTLLIFRDINLPETAESINPLVLQRGEDSLFHWVFGTDEAEYQSISGDGDALDIVKTGGDPDPVLSAGYVTVKYSPSLDTNWHKGNNFTVCIAAKFNGAAQGNVYFGNKVAESITTENGLHLVSNSTGATLQAYIGDQVPGDVDLLEEYAFTGGGAFNGWFFFAFSLTPTSFKMVFPQGTTQQDTVAGTYDVGDYVPTYKIGGWARGQTFGQNTADIAEVIVFDSALTIAQMQDVYARSVARLADRGIEFE